MDRTDTPPHDTATAVPGTAAPDSPAPASLAPDTGPYTGAPDLDAELHALLDTPADVPAPADGSGRTDAQRLAHREALLRRAAAWDRTWLREGTIAAATLAAAAARRLLAWDRAMLALDPPLTTHHGPVPPGSPRWDLPGAGRAYIRQEYPAWLTRTRTCNYQP